MFYQSWRNLLFLHWKVPISVIKDTLPPSLTVDTWHGSAYLGIIPFRMLNLRPSFAFPIPALSNFPEINLRTYVLDKQGRKGVWFFSLDTENPLGNWIARRFFYLNYRYAKTYFKSMSPKEHQCSVLLKNTKFEKQRFEWEESEDYFLPSNNRDSLEYFLTERYRLFSYNRVTKQLYSGQIVHEPYVLNRPKLKRFSLDLVEDNISYKLPIRQPDSVLAASGTDVRVYTLEKVL